MSSAVAPPPGGTTTFGVAATRPETLADRRSFLTDGFAPVRCGDCGTEVLVRKTSREQTSIQWLADPSATCPVFAGRSASGRPACSGCPALLESITTAAKLGRVAIGSGGPEEER
ncbi:hypothetical protein [Tsukamurella soli]|uniref:Ferredoxin n=1 Tax=Tsukamurella soli TaxID=644556 RepID=A0ABP8K0T1_9ACTN